MNNNTHPSEEPNFSWQTQLKFDAQKFLENIQESSDRSLLTIMGTLNGLAFHLCLKFKAFEKVEDEYKILQPQVNELIKSAQSGLAEVPLATTWLKSYLTKYWHGASSSLPTLRKVRETLSSLFELFTYQKGEVVAKRCDRNPPILKEINLFRLLLIYEMCEEELIIRGMEIKEIGEWFGGIHKGNFMRLLYNAVFGGVLYRRKSTNPDPEPVPVDEELIAAIATIEQINNSGDRPDPEVLEKCWGVKSLNPSWARLRDRIVNMIQYFSDWGNWEDYGFLPMVV
jgi:hypothetical protein